MGWTGGNLRGSLPARRPGRTAAAVALVLLLASPVSAWFVMQRTDLLDPSPAAPVHAASTWIHDHDGDRIDDRLPERGLASAILPFTHAVSPEELARLDAIPTLKVVHSWSIVDGAWVTLDLDYTSTVLDLPFVKRIEADPILTPTLDVTTRALHAQDARAGVFANGTAFDFIDRGVWRRENGLQGVTGDGVMVALLDGGIDDTHPALDDLDDDVATSGEPKVALKLNVWAYAVLNATVGQQQPVGATYPFVIEDPGPQPDQPIPNECQVDPTVAVYYCGLARPIGGSVLAYTWPQDGGPICWYPAASPSCLPSNPVISRYPRVDDLDVIPNNPGVPGSPLPPNANMIAGEYDLFFEPPFAALPHATALASAIAGTGDSQGTPTGATAADRWAYSGVAPGAKLVDVNLFVGVDSECAPVSGTPVEEAAGDAGCPAGPRGSTTGLQVNSGNAALAQTGSTLITGAEMVQRYNAENGDAANPPIGVAVIPLLDLQSCDEGSYDTLIEAAVDELAQTNVTVITSVGQGQDGICVPANVPRTLAIGARDGLHTPVNHDDMSWDAMSIPSENQDGVAKPDLTVPGVNVWTARSAPNDFYEVTGSSVAAAQAAGVAALVLEAGNRSVQGLALKTQLIQTADGFFSPGLDPNGYQDGGDSNAGDGLRDDGRRRGWQGAWGFGGINARTAVCDLRQCPLPWEGLRTAVLPDAQMPFPISAHVREDVTFVGRAIIDDARAGSFWLNRSSEQHYTFLGGVGPGAHVNFAFTDSPTNDTSAMLPIAHAVTQPDGAFNLTFTIPADKRPGALFCVLWVETLEQTADRDGLLPSPGLPCILNVFSSSYLELDLCGENDACDPAHPIVSFLDDPTVDFLRGIVRLTDASGQIIENQTLRVTWEGADDAYKDVSLRTAQNTGEALIKLPLGGKAGVFDLNITFTPLPGDNHDAATLLVPVTVSLGTQADIELVGREPGAVMLNDGSTLPVAVTGTLRTFLGDPIPKATVELAVDGRLQKALGTARTDDQGRFSLGLDARPLQAGAYGLYVRYVGEKAPAGPGYSLLPTTSFRVPFTIVVQPRLSLAEQLEGHRGEEVSVEGLATNPFGRPLANETLVANWIGGSSLMQTVKTDRSGHFTFTRTLPADEPLGPLLLLVQYTGSPELAPAETIRSLEVLGRSSLSVFPGEVRRGGTAQLQGFLYDDTGRPLVAQKVAVDWGSLHVGNASTDSLGRYAINYPVPVDERAGPVTVRVAYGGRPFIEPSNAQGILGVLAPTDLQVGGGNRSANQVLEFSTRLIDDQGHVVTDPQPIEIYIAPPRADEDARVTYLSPLDLSQALAPELRLSHAYRLATGFGVSDGARVQVSLDAGRSWTTITPRDGYPDQAVAAFGATPGFDGETAGWFPQRVDLRAFGNESDVRLRWRVATSPLNNDLSIGVDDVRLRNGNDTLFFDDFERFGSKSGANYWSVPAVGGLVVGRETFTGNHAGVLASNLQGTYPPRTQQSALGPAVNLPAAAPTFAALRYRLDTGNAEDYATLSLRLGNDTILLAPVNEPQMGQLPDTEGKWRWLFYELPSSSRGRQGRLHLSFQSDGLLGGEGLQVDEVRMLRGPDVVRAPISADSGHWTLNNFNAGLPHDLDTYVASQDTRPYQPIASPVLRKLDGPVLLGLGQMPFPVKFFGESYDRITVYPEGVAALGNTLDQDPNLLCRALPPGQSCHLAEVPGFGAPLVAPAWDSGLRTGTAFLATGTAGEAPNRQLILEWRGLQAPDAPAGTSVRFSAVFHEDGDVEYRYGTLFFGNADHDLGANATVGIGQPGRPSRSIEVLSHAPSLTDNLRIYLARVQSHPTAEVQSTCPPARAPCLVIAPNPAGAYKASATSEAIFESGVDLSKSGEAYLVTRQFVDMGRGDALTISARPFGSNSWRNLPVLMGGQSALGGAFQPDHPGQWSTVVYDLSSMVGQRAKVRFQIGADGAGQDVGVLLRDLEVLSLPRTAQAANVDSFNSYLDTSQAGATWWSSRQVGQTEAQPAWSVRTHTADRPDELGDAFLGLGSGQPLDPSSQFVLTSPPFDLRGHKTPVLEWWQSFTPTDDLDGAVLEISTDGGVSYRPIRPEGDGYADLVPTLNSIGWRGPQFGFVTDTFDLTPYTGSDVRLRLDLGLGDGPFPALWILDEVNVVDRLGLGDDFVAEDGAFGANWDHAADWTPVPQASAIARSRDGVQQTTVLHVTGAATQHRIALPDDAPRGPIQATMLYRGASDTFGGAISSAQLVLQAEAQFSGLQVANDKDGRGHLLRGRTFTLEGQLRSLDGQALAGRLVQIELGGVAVGSARTGADGRFETSPLQVLGTMPLGKSTLRVEYGGDPADHVQGTVVEMPVAVKALAQLRVESQVARGDQLDVVVAILDDLGKPLARTAAVVAVVGETEEVSVITDGNGLAHFSTPVPETKESEVAFEVRALGTQDVLGTSLAQATVVPAAPGASLWPYFLAGGLLLAGAIAALIVVLLRRRRIEGLQEALHQELERTRYQLQTGDAVRESIFGLYRAFLDALARAGRPVTPQQTAQEVAAILGGLFAPAQRADIAVLTGLFSEARYSEATLGEADRQRALSAVQRLEGALAAAAVKPEAAP